MYYSGNQKWDTPNTGPGDFTMAALVQRCRDRYNIFIMFSNPQISDIQKLFFGHEEYPTHSEESTVPYT